MKPPKEKSARAKAQIQAVKTLEALIRPGSTVYFVDRTQATDGHGSIVDPLVLSGGGVIYIRELLSVLGPFPLHAGRAGLYADGYSPDGAMDLAVKRLCAYVHVGSGLPILNRWL
jgi:hypothetical protein